MSLCTQCNPLRSSVILSEAKDLDANCCLTGENEILRFAQDDAAA